MIKAKELRIGNWLWYDEQMEYVQVVQIGYEDKWKAEADEVFPKQEDCEPIPLTPEILEKCGFTMDRHLAYRGIRVFSPIVRWRPDINTLEVDGTFGITSLLYLHQVQNWFFALTGEELEVKL